MRKRVFGLLVAAAVALPVFVASPANAAPTGHCHWWSEPNVIVGSRGHDRLVGTDCFDTIFGLQGSDRIIGRSREDTLNGGRGNDRIRAVDGFADLVRCGLGKRDRAVVDQYDTATRCETVRIVPV